MSSRVFVNHAVDPAGVYALGVDLDHTLAVYDHDLANSLATAETLRYLVENRGYPEAILGIAYDGARTARGLAVDPDRGTVVKLDHAGRVRRARRRGRWLDQAEIAGLYGHDRLSPDERHAIHSAFDLPVAFLFDEVTRVLGGLDAAAPAGDEIFRDIRVQLDRAHTRGRLKGKIASDLERHVRPVRSLAPALERLRAAGRRLFVLTNSGEEYTRSVLDYLFDGQGAPRWQDLFHAVLVDAEKPGFFDDESPPTGAPPGGRTPVVERGSAQLTEELLGASRGAILYAGDHAAYDTAAARRRGWRTVQVVPEIDETDRGHDAQRWGSSLREDGSPTWFARLLGAESDLVAARLEPVLVGLGRGSLTGSTWP